MMLANHTRIAPEWTSYRNPSTSSSSAAVRPAAHCVALSEDSAKSVAEAGRDVTPASMPSVLALAYPGRTYFQTEWLWGSLQASRGDSGTNQPTKPWFYEQARILGGGSSINCICASRFAVRL
jgi:hypothetical protein